MKAIALFFVAAELCAQVSGAGPKTPVKTPAGGRGAAAAAERPVAAAKPAAPTAPPGPRDLKYPPLHTVQPPELVAATLPNGLRLYLSEDHERPVIGGVVLVRTGGAFDPPERIGLANMAGYLVRHGGTQTKSGEAVDQALSSLGMTLESAFGDTAGVVSFSGLRRNAESSLTFLRELLVQPEFRQDRVEQARADLRNRIAHRNDDLNQLATREFNGLIFGKDSPYGWQTDYTGLNRITRSDLQKFHKRYFFPANMMIGIYGDFNASEMKATVEKVFGSWSASQEPAPSFPAAKPAVAGGIFLGEKKDAPETHLVIGHLGGLVTDKDYPALQILGLAFNQVQGHITQRVRSQVGIPNARLMGVSVENVRAAWAGGFVHAGTFHIAATCRGAATSEAVAAIREDVEQMRTKEITEEELRYARDRAIGDLAAVFDTPAEAFRRAMLQEYYGLPRDFAQRYQAGLAAVTRADVLRVAKQYLRPDALTTLVIGNSQVFATPLEKLNPQVNRVDLTIPEPKGNLTETTDASLAEGKKILQRAQQAVGGAEKLAAVKTYAIATDYDLDASVPNIGGKKVPQLDRWIFPAIFRQDLVLPTGRISVYTDGATGWITAPQGWGALTGAQRKQVEGDLFRSYFRLLLSDRIEGRTVNKVDDNLIEITDATGQLTRLEFDPKTGLPRRGAYDVAQAAGPPLFTEEFYDDFREVNGIKYPFKTVITQAGKRFAEVAVTDCKFNPPIRQIELGMRPQ